VERRARRIAGDVSRGRDAYPVDRVLRRRVRRATRRVVVGKAGDQRGAGDDRQREQRGGEEAPTVRYSNRQGSPAANDLRILRATTMRCTSSGPS
jgi:hypothetical protein